MSTETETEAPKLLALGERGDPARLQLAEHVFRILHHGVGPTRTAADLERFDYWSRCTEALMVGDFVVCEPADRRWFVVLRVLEIFGEGVVMQPISGVATMRYQPPAQKRGKFGTNDDEYEFRRSEEFPDKWGVVRAELDGTFLVMTKGKPLSHAQCREWLARHLVMMRSS
jgi:hypothetical protein